MKVQKTMLKVLSLITCLLLLFSSCKKKNEPNPTVDSFLPMQVGNYWGTANRQNNYTEIQEEVQINDKTYYKFYSLIGGDAIAISYLRIDEQNRLVESYPKDPSRIYVRADFNAKVGDVFFTLNDQTVNDYKVVVANKTENAMSFNFDMIYHPNLKGQIRTDTYIKGRGWNVNFEKIIINGKVVKGK